MVSELISYSFIPFFSAIALPFFARKDKSITVILANVAILSGFLSITYTVVGTILGKTNLSDPFAYFMIFTIYLVALAVVFFSSYYQIENDTNYVSYYSLILVSVSAMSSLVIVKDLFTIYIFIEAISVCSFALITSTTKKQTIESAIKYFFLTFPASVVIILGISLVLASVKTLDLDAISGSSNIMTAVGLSFVVVGFLIKSGVVPFHFWTPDVYQGAYSPISSYLAGIVTKISGMYAIVRIILSMKYLYSQHFTWLLILTSILTILVGSFGAMIQKDMKRMLAYSSISQMGYILLGLATFSSQGIIAAIFHLFNHATFKTVLFLNAACIEKSTNTTDMTHLKGLEKRMPYTAWTSVIASMSTAGIPPLSGFWSKVLVIIAVWQAGYVSVAVIALLASILTLGYFVLLQRKIFFGKITESLTDIKEASFPMLVPIVFLSAIIILSGLFANYIYSFLEKMV